MARATELFLKTFHIEPGKIIRMSSTNSGFYKAVGGTEIILMPVTVERYLPPDLVPAYCTIRGHRLKPQCDSCKEKKGRSCLIPQKRSGIWFYKYIKKRKNGFPM
ncbi:MAG: hypothetical protein ACLUD2_20400 [Clostridium sp.]